MKRGEKAPTVSAVDDTLTDDKILALLRMKPSAAREMQARAAGLYRQAANASPPVHGLAVVWDTFCRRMQTRATGPVEAHRIAIEALAFFVDASHLTFDERYVLVGAELPDTEQARGVMERYPALRAWLHTRDERRREADSAQAAELKRMQQRYAEEAPVLLLARLRSAGLQLAVHGDDLMLPAAADIRKALPGDIEAIRDHKEALMVILRADATPALLKVA